MVRDKSVISQKSLSSFLSRKEKIVMVQSLSPKGVTRTPEVEARIAKILAFDLTRPKAFLVVRQGMDPQLAQEMELQYKRYLVLIALFPEIGFPISNPVDELWHAHLLFTNEYAEMSALVNGSYVHHMPTLTEDERAELEPAYFSMTLGLYRQTFGEEPPIKFWPTDSGSICWSKTNCTPEQLKSSYEHAQSVLE